MTHFSKEISGSLGRYQLLKQIGSGGTGKVWLGSDPHLHRQVAIKVLPPRVQGDQDAQARFERKVEAIATLNHPHILPIHDFGIQSLSDGQFITYFVMPYIAEGSLADLLAQQVRERQKSTVDKVLMWLAQVADALDYAHAQGVVHGNVKLTNLLMRSEDWLLLADFGITDTQAGGDKPCPYDIDSLAVVASLLLTNQLSVHVRRHVRFSSDLPSACKAVLLRGMAEEAGERYPSARAFVDALQASFPTTLRDGKNKRVTRRILLLGGGVAVAGSGLWALSVWSQKTQQQTKSVVDPDAPFLFLQEHRKSVQTLAWAPNKHVFVSASGEDAQIKVWDLALLQPQQPARFKSYLARAWSGSDLVVAWSPDGTSLALASRERTDTDNTSHIVLLNPTLNGWDGGPEQRFLVPAPAVEGLGWLKQTLLVAVWNDPTQSGVPGYLGLWDTQQPDLTIQPARMSEVFTTRTSLDLRCTLAVTQDRTRMAICTTNGALIGSAEIIDNAVAWQSVWPDLLQYQPGSNLNEVKALAWSAKGGNLLVLPKNGTRNTLMAWGLVQNVKKLDPFPALSPAIHFNAIAVSPTTDKSMFAAGTEEGEIYLWNGDVSNIPFRTLKSGGIRGKVLSLSWSFDGQWLAASYDDQKASILLWKL